MISYKLAVELFGVARDRTLTTILEYIGGRTLALDKEYCYAEPSGEYTAMNYLRKLDHYGIEVQDVSEGAENDEPIRGWGEVPDFVLLELLHFLEQGAVHDYDPEEDS